MSDRKALGIAARSWLRLEGGWLLYAGIVALLFIMVLVGAAFGHIDGKDAAGWAFPLLGTFMGAFLAFRLQSERERRAEHKAQLNAVNRAILTLAAQYNHLFVFKRNLLDRYEQDAARMLNLPAEGLGDQFDARLRPEELIFLAYKGEGELVMNLSVEQGRFDSAREVVATRCALLLEEIYPLVEQHQLRGRQVSAADVEAAFGERLFESLATATDQVYLHVPSTVNSLFDVATKLHGAAKRIFPDDKVLRLTRSDQPTQAPAAAATGGQPHPG